MNQPLPPGEVFTSHYSLLLFHFNVTEDIFMLVLSRKPGESVVINRQITVRVIEIRGDRVRIGIEAPREIPVHRTELLQRMEKTVAVA
jgi:carbon storage regulator